VSFEGRKNAELAHYVYPKRKAVEVARTLPGQTVEGTDLNVVRATRLMRLHLEQIEAMQKLKGKEANKR
jgi:hypothetical protein